MSVIRSQCKDDDEYFNALRDEFAGKALQGWLSAGNMLPKNREIYTDRAYKDADAMLRTRNPQATPANGEGV